MRHWICGLLLIPTMMAGAVAQTSGTINRSSVLPLMAERYGAADPSNPLAFRLKDGYKIVAKFAPSDELIGFEIKAAKMPDSITSVEFQDTLTFINSIKSLGTLEENLGVSFVSGMRAHNTAHYSEGYLSTAEVLCRTKPCPIAYASVDYLYPKSGTVRLPESFRLNDAGSFGLYCIDHREYRLPLSEAKKAVEAAGKQLRLLVAGPFESCD